VNLKLSLNKITKIRRNAIKTRTQAKQPDAGFVRLNAHVLDFLKNILSKMPSRTPVLRLGLSGGVDSCVLLAALMAAKKALLFDLQVMHVHHGLSPNADRWAEFCAMLCLQYKVPFVVERVKIDKKSGLGIEASARNARYQALFKGQFDYLVLAHHQDDQAETFLLQLLRGAGLKGLSAMASQDTERRLIRPLLDVSRQEIEEYAKAAQLSWVEDESNDEVYFDRNYCRHNVMPVIESRFPSAKKTLARSAGHMAEAAGLLDDLAEMDAQRYAAQGALKTEGFEYLSDARAKNLLRWWLAQQGVSMPSKDRLDEMLIQLRDAKSDAKLKVQLGDVVLRRYQGFVYLKSEIPTYPISLCWQGEDSLMMPDGSMLIFERKQGEGLAIGRLGGHKLRITHRKGGERFKPDLARPTRTLKYLLQEANMPPWQRDRLPLVYLDDSLAVVPNVGVNCQMQVGKEEEGLAVTWQNN
jgi:tRNA(Ile)-lysidine synthase